MALVVLSSISKKAVFLAAKIYNLTGGWHAVSMTALSVIFHYYLCWNKNVFLTENVLESAFKLSVKREICTLPLTQF